MSNFVKLKYLGTVLMCEECIHEEIVMWGKRKGLCWVLVGKPEGRRPLVRHRHRWEGSLKLDLKVIDWEGMERINLA
jgi:hypothetical protein